MIDLALTDAGELYLDANQDLAFLDGHAETIAAVQALIRSWLGEWWLDTTFGIDYLGKFLIKDNDFSPAAAASELRRKALAVEGVLRIDNLTVALSADGAQVTVGMLVTTIFDDSTQVILTV
jgi:hypothetical protein